MTDRELLLSLHQKVDRNHKWVKRQFGSILQNMTITQNSVKKNHYYMHEVFDRTWVVMSHLYGEEDPKQMGFKQDFDWSQPPSKKFKKVKVPHLVASCYSSSRDLVFLLSYNSHSFWRFVGSSCKLSPMVV